MSTTVDIVIIGSGVAAQSIAFRCSSAGRSVMVIDSRPFGGTCELRGCEPKKIFVNAADIVDWSRRMQGKGISPASAISWSDLQHYKRSFTDPVSASIEQSFQKAGIQMRHGRAHFVDQTTLQVGDETITARFIILTNGARHAPLDVPGEEYLITSTQFMELEELPQRIVFVGGGYIAFEFTHVSARAGAEVHVIDRGARPLSKFDADLVAQLVQETEELGVKLHANTTLKSIEKHGDHFHVSAEEGSQQIDIEADLVVHAAGRVPEIEDLKLEVAGVKYDKGGITVNEYLQSVSNPAVYAAGDVVASGKLPLTPVATLQGDIVADNILNGNQRKPNYEGIPSVVYTIPPLARVGLDEETAKEQGLKFTTKKEDTSGWYSSRRVAISHSGFKVLIEDDTQRILGAHLFGWHADETINLIGLAIRNGLPASALKDMVYAFPTSASDLNSMF